MPGILHQVLTPVVVWAIHAAIDAYGGELEIASASSTSQLKVFAAYEAAFAAAAPRASNKDAKVFATLALINKTIIGVWNNLQAASTEVENIVGKEMASFGRNFVVPRRLEKQCLRTPMIGMQ